jgi:hypothetical protein
MRPQNLAPLKKRLLPHDRAAPYKDLDEIRAVQDVSIPSMSAYCRTQKSGASPDGGFFFYYYRVNAGPGN